MVKFIAAMIVFIGAVIVTLYFGAIKIHNYSSDNLELEVWVEPEEVSLADETFTIYCSIVNLTDEPLEFSGFFFNMGPQLGWCNWAGNRPELLIKKPDGSWINLMVYNKVSDSSESRAVLDLPADGMSGKGTYSATALNLCPGEHTVAFTLMGKTRESKFTISH